MLIWIESRFSYTQWAELKFISGLRRLGEFWDSGLFGIVGVRKFMGFHFYWVKCSI